MRNKLAYCSIEGCNRPWRSRKWCYFHYHRWLRHGNPLYGELEERFWRKVNKKEIEKCWPWLGKARRGKNRGYGQLSINDKSYSAHRISWKLTFGEIPQGLHVLHHCDNPICQNPKHLFLGTNLDNIRDKMSKGHWRGGRPKFIPKICPRCKRLKQIVKGYCRSCYSTIRRQLMGRFAKGPSPF